MSVIKADVEVCQGYANCVVAAADVFDIGDAGTVVILDDTVAES
ncbi:ferredoxin, partial [Mycolicibacterium sp. PAM1]